MNEPARRINLHPEDHSPKEKPAILNEAEAARDGFVPYKDIAVKVDYLEINDSFKFVGLANEGLGPFENIGAFNDKYRCLVKNALHSITAFGMFTNLPDDSRWDYYFGVQVGSLDDIPEGLAGFDLHTKRFAVMTVVANSMYELVGDEKGPGQAMMTAEEYTDNIWLPVHRDIAITDDEGKCGKVIIDGKIYHTGCFECYPDNPTGEIMMQFYIPLKEKAL